MLAVSCVKHDKKTVGPSVEGVAADAAESEIQQSSKSLIQRKRANVIRNTLAKALMLDPKGMCLELGRIPCADNAHRVSLGGMDAYGASQYQYLAKISVTSPNSLDRVVLSACIQRASLDLINPAQAVIFKDVKMTIDGRLVASVAIDQALDRLYQRAFMRNITAPETAALKGMYETIYAEEPLGAARNWMVLACYAALSTLEGAFY